MQIPTDEAVAYELVLRDLSDRDIPTCSVGQTIYVSRYSLADCGFYLTDVQLASDLTGRFIPRGITQSIREENRVQIEIWPSNARLAEATMVETGSLALRDFEPTSFPDCKMLITFFRRGISADKRFVMIRFAIAPTGHFATGTYLLERNTNSWRIEWREFAFYL